MTRENQVCHSRSAVQRREVSSHQLTLHPVFVQAVHAEMEDALHERDELKMRVHSYITEVSRIETLIATKVRANI